MLSASTRPVILLGQGARAAGADCSRLMDLGIPVLTSWLAKDLVDNWHPMYFGSPGVYGNRLANRVLWEADCVIAIGNRLSIWNVGYSGLRPDQRLVMVDCDPAETSRFENAELTVLTIPEFIASLKPTVCHPWVAECFGWRQRFPFLEPDTHADTNGRINSFRFTAALQEHLKTNAVIVTDNGCNMVPAFSVLRLKPPQRIFSSGGIGEMGCGLPMAVGASFARDGGEVLLLAGDGGMMMNLQELQTIVHHNLPVKIIVYANDGYLMIKHSQSVLGVVRSGTDRASGLSCPSFVKIARAFGIRTAEVYQWLDFKPAMEMMFWNDGPALIEYHMDPEQFCGPKLQPIKNADGTVSSPEFWDVSPRL